MPQLPPEWAAHLESGTSHRVGSCHADGRPEICRALAARALPDGQVELVLHRDTGAELLAAVGTSQRVAYVASQPDTNRTLHLKGTHAQSMPVTAAHMAMLACSRDRFIARVEPFGFSPETITGFWFEVEMAQLAGIRFTLCGAWDQSPGPGAGQAIELLP